MFGSRGFVGILVAACLMLGNRGLCAQEEDLVKTYRSEVEKTLQGLMSVAAPVTSTNGSFGDILNLFEDKFHAIFPGTLWCGSGNIASNEEDVGVFEQTDTCCRDHDNCPASINAGKSRENLLNDGAFTRSACFCDEQFYRCLKDVGTVVSANIGTTYFNILRPQCFSYNYPIESCAKQDSDRLVDKKCLEYNLDETRNITLSWFDTPDF